MRRLIATVLTFLLVAVSSGCASRKPPQPSAILGESALASLRELVAAYEKEDRAAFAAKVSKGFPEREAFLRSLSAVFAKYDSFRFTVQYAKMLIMIEEKGKMKATFTWDAEWQQGGRITKDGGRVTLVFDPKGAWLQAIEGKNPFVPVENQSK